MDEHDENEGCLPMALGIGIVVILIFVGFGAVGGGAPAGPVPMVQRVDDGLHAGAGAVLALLLLGTAIAIVLYGYKPRGK